MMLHKTISPAPAEPDQSAGRGTRIPDTPTLLAVLAARQRVLPTATAMRGDRTPIGPAPADRMVRLFGAPVMGKTSASGAFNLGIARLLLGTDEGRTE